MKRVTGPLVWAALCCLFPNTQVFGKSLELFRSAVPDRGPHIKLATGFKANLEEPSLQRAWIQIVVRTEAFEGENRSLESTHRVSVKGLQYDPETRQIVYVAEGRQPVICASVTEALFLSSAGRIVQSGNCRIHSRVEKELSDDGYFRRSHPVVTVTLEVGE
jgi:hypothetical protein